MSNLERSILATLVYFDIFDYPLTLIEIWRYLYRQSTIDNQQSVISNQRLTSDKRQMMFSIFDIQKTLESSEKLKKAVSYKNGFYFLKGREKLVRKRQEHYSIAQSKWKIAQKAAKYLQLVPFIKMIAVCNTLAYDNTTEKSDIDFFIVVKSDRIWTARFLAILIIYLLGLRPTSKRIKDKICLSFYTTDKLLNLERIALKPYDIYLAYWINQIIPLVNRENTYARFIQSNVVWTKKYFHLPLGTAKYLLQRETPDRGLFSLIRVTKEKILGTRIANILEKGLRKIQLIFMSKTKKNLAKKLGTEVIISNEMLKFHESDRREKFRRRFEEKYKQYLSQIKG